MKDRGQKEKIMRGDSEEKHHSPKNLGRTWLVAKGQSQEQPKADTRTTVSCLMGKGLGKQAK